MIRFYRGLSPAEATALGAVLDKDDPPTTWTTATRLMRSGTSADAIIAALRALRPGVVLWDVADEALADVVIAAVGGRSSTAVAPSTLAAAVQSYAHSVSSRQTRTLVSLAGEAAAPATAVADRARAAAAADVIGLSHAIVAHSGAGKSTAAGADPRLLDIDDVYAAGDEHVYAELERRLAGTEAEDENSALWETLGESTLVLLTTGLERLAAQGTRANVLLMHGPYTANFLGLPILGVVLTRRVEFERRLRLRANDGWAAPALRRMAHNYATTVEYAAGADLPTWSDFAEARGAIDTALAAASSDVGSVAHATSDDDVADEV